MYIAPEQVLYPHLWNSWHLMFVSFACIAVCVCTWWYMLCAAVMGFRLLSSELCVVPPSLPAGVPTGTVPRGVWHA